MRVGGLIQAPSSLGDVDVYYNSAFLTESQATQFLQISLLSRADRQRSKRSASAKVLGSNVHAFEDDALAEQAGWDTDAIASDLKFLRASLMDTDGRLLLKDGINDQSTSSYKKLQRLIQRRPASAGTDPRFNKHRFGYIKFMKSKEFYELLPEAQAGLLNTKMRVDFSLLLNEKSQKELDTSINFINKGINLFAATRGMEEDVLSAYKRSRPASAQTTTNRGLLSPHEIGVMLNQSKTESRPASMRRSKPKSADDLRDRLCSFVINDSVSRRCFGDTYNSITQGNRPETFDSLVRTSAFTPLVTTPERASQVTTVVLPTLSYYTNDEGRDAPRTPDNEHEAHLYENSAPLLMSAQDSAYKSDHPLVDLPSEPLQELAVTDSNNSTLPCLHSFPADQASESVNVNDINMELDTRWSVTDEITIDLEGNMCVVSGDSKKPSRKPSAVHREEYIPDQSLHIDQLDHLEAQGVILLDDDITASIHSQPSTQSTVRENSLNTSLGRTNTPQKTSRSEFRKRHHLKLSGAHQRGSASEAVSQGHSFRQPLHTDKCFPATFQPKTTHVAASHSTLDISEGPIEIRNMRRIPHSTGRSIPVVKPENSIVLDALDRLSCDCSSGKASILKTSTAQPVRNSTDTANQVDHLVIVPERQGFKGSVITSYQRAITNMRKASSERDLKQTAKSEHTVNLKKVYSGLNFDKNSFATDGSTPLMTIKATVPSTSMNSFQRSGLDPTLEGSSEAIAPAEITHSILFHGSQADAYPIIHTTDYSEQKNDMEDVVDLPEDFITSNTQSISCLVNSQLQRSDLETSLVIPRMDVLKYLERSADLLGSMIGETSTGSDDLNQEEKLVLHKGSKPKNDTPHQPLNVDHTPRDQTLAEQLYDFREVVKQELSQQSQHSQRTSVSIKSLRQSTSTRLLTGVEDLPPQTFIDSTVIPLQKRLDTAIAVAMSKRAKLCMDESDTLANYIDILDEVTDERPTTPTVESFHPRPETPQISDYNVIAENVSNVELQASTIGLSKEVPITKIELKDEPFIISRSDTQRPCVDIHHDEYCDGSMEPRLTMVHINSSLSPATAKREKSVSVTKEPARIFEFPKEEAKHYTSLQASACNDQSGDIPVNYEAKVVLEDYELDANFPILAEAAYGIDPTGESAVMLANYKKLTMEAVQKAQQRLTFDLGYDQDGDRLNEDSLVIASLEEGDNAEINRKSTINSAEERPSSGRPPKNRSKMDIVANNWRLFAGKGSSIVDDIQPYQRKDKLAGTATQPYHTHQEEQDFKIRKPYDKNERYMLHQFLPVASMSHAFKAEATGGTHDSNAQESFATPVTSATPTGVVMALSANLDDVKAQFNQTARCAKSLLLTRDLERSNDLSKSAEHELSIDTPVKTPLISSQLKFNVSSIASGSTILENQPVKKLEASIFSPRSAFTSSLRVSSFSKTSRNDPRIKSAAICKLIDEIKTLDGDSNNTQKAISVGLGAPRKQSSQNNTRTEGYQRRNEKLQKAAKLLDKPRQKASRSFSATQSELFNDLTADSIGERSSFSNRGDSSESHERQTGSAQKRTAFISSTLAPAAGTDSKTSVDLKNQRFFSSRATYEAQTIRVGNSTRIKTRTLYLDQPVALKPTTQSTTTPANTASMQQENEFLSAAQTGVFNLSTKEPKDKLSQPGKMVRVTDPRIGQWNQELLKSAVSTEPHLYSSYSWTFRQPNEVVLVAPSPTTKTLIAQTKQKDLADRKEGKKSDEKRITSAKVSNNRKDNDVKVQSSLRTSINKQSRANTHTILANRPRSAIILPQRDIQSKSTTAYESDTRRESSATQPLQTPRIGLESLSIMARTLAVQSPERLLKDPYDVAGTMRDEAERFILCRGFRVSSAGKLRLPSTIEKDIVLDVRSLNKRPASETGLPKSKNHG